MITDLSWEEQKKLWCEALRSGEYEQGRHNMLRASADGSSPRFCCLGVYADLFIEAEWEPLGDTTMFGFKDHGVLSISMLPKYMIPPQLDEAQPDLAEMNDSGCDFDKIADYIEENL